MRYKDKTLEELEDLELEFDEQEEMWGYPNYSLKIEYYKELYKRYEKLVHQRQNDYKDSLAYVKKKLIYHLIHYGTYLKTEYQKDDYMAALCLKEALKYDRTNPIPAYRLGFLSYKKRNYSEAIKFFQKALKNHQHDSQPKLTSQQEVFLHLYLSNSALHIATETYEKMNQLPAAKTLELPDLEFSPLFRSLFENDQYLKRHAFYRITNKANTTCSKEECEQLIQSPPPQTIILYFSDRNILAVFEDEAKAVELSVDEGKLLRHFLLNTTEERPATRSAFAVVENMKANTYSKKVSRLRNKLLHNGFPPFIMQKRYQNETAYYFDGTFSFEVMFRVDEEIE
jgi:tetratricopeptide (TPR) repeat protein